MVKANETNLEGVLEGNRQYQVPLYQRTYSWGKKQVDQLWSDLVEIADARRLRPTATHFIGSLVLSASPDNGAVGVQKFLVVDGQQRLTTLTLLLAALRDHQIATEGDHHRERIDEQYLINKHQPGARTKLLPTQADRTAYLAVIEAAAQAGGDDRVGETYRAFRSKIAAADDPDDPFDIAALETAVLRGLALVAVTAEPTDNAHRIFESLNNTGLRLTQADLLKNYLFMRLGGRADAVYGGVWHPLEKKLDSVSLELLFWLDLVRSDEKATQADTFLGQQRRLEAMTPDEVEAEIVRIAALGDLLATILEPGREKNPAVRDRLQRIKDWGSTTAYPLVLQLLNRRAEGAASDQQVADALLCLESYFVRRIVIGRATNSLNRTLLQATNVLADEPDVGAGLRRFLSTGRRHFATDQQIRDAVTSVPFYWQGRATQKKLILLWLEAALRGKELVDPAGLTIEHVLPQTMTADVTAQFGHNLEPENVIAEHGRLVHTIGNLTLSGYNSELSNRPFSAKRTEFAKSALALSHEIARCTHWGVEEIQERGVRLGELIIQLWPGPDESLVAPGDAASETRTVVASVVAAIPAGRWTTYADVARVSGSHPVGVGAILAGSPVPNAWRVLQAGGTVSPQFRWSDPGRFDEPRVVLEAEGVRFDDAGHASAEQYLGAASLAQAAGYEVDLTLEAEGGGSTLGSQQVAFWEAVRSWGQGNAIYLNQWRAARPKHWLTLDSLGQSVTIELTVNSWETRLAAEVYVANNKPLFTRLFREREVIEAELGFGLDWREMPQNKASRIVASREGDFRDEAQRQKLIEWLVETADALARAFRDRL